MCNVPTSVPKSHFDITSYKEHEQTVSKEKDTSIGKETNGKEALKLTFVGARKILNPIKQYFENRITDEPDDDGRNDELQPPNIIDKGIKEPSSENKGDENSFTKLMKQLHHQYYHQYINTNIIAIKYFKVNTRSEETYLIAMTTKDRID